VKAAGYAVDMLAELGSGMQAGHHSLQSRDALSRDGPCRDASSVVRYCDAAVLMDCDVNAVTAARHGFVYAVIYYLVEDWCNPCRSVPPIYMPGSQAHGPDFIKDLDVFGRILVIAWLFMFLYATALQKWKVMEGYDTGFHLHLMVTAPVIL
jgi:hypothetical protein